MTLLTKKGNVLFVSLFAYLSFFKDTEALAWVYIYMKTGCYTLSYPWTKSFAIHALRMRVPCGVFST